MLKRTALVSVAILLLCAIACAALVPIAASDAIAMARLHSEEYLRSVPLLEESAEGIVRVCLSGDWLEQLDVRPSADGKIRFSTDGYNMGERSATALRGADGTLLLSLSYQGGLQLLSRENITRGILGALNNASGNRYLLELPDTVTLDFSDNENARRHLRLNVDPRVQVIEPTPPEAEAAAEAEAASQQSVPAPPAGSPELLDAMAQKREALLQLYEEAGTPKAGRDDAALRAQGDALIDEMTALLRQLSPASFSSETTELEEFCHLRMHEHLLSRARVRLKSRYLAGELTRAEYLAADLELASAAVDAAAESAEYPDIEAQLRLLESDRAMVTGLAELPAIE